MNSNVADLILAYESKNKPERITSTTKKIDIEVYSSNESSPDEYTNPSSQLKNKKQKQNKKNK